MALMLMESKHMLKIYQSNPIKVPEIHNIVNTDKRSLKFERAWSRT